MAPVAAAMHLCCRLAGHSGSKCSFIPRPLRTFKMNSRSLFDMARSASRCMAAIAPTKLTETHHFRLQTILESVPILPCTRAAGLQAFFATGCIQGLSCRSKHWIVFRKSNEGRLKASGTSKSCPAGRAPGATDRRPLSHFVRPICETSSHTLELLQRAFPAPAHPHPRRAGHCRSSRRTDRGHRPAAESQGTMTEVLRRGTPGMKVRPPNRAVAAAGHPCQDFVCVRDRGKVIRRAPSSKRKAQPAPRAPALGCRSPLAAWCLSPTWPSLLHVFTRCTVTAFFMPI